MRGRAIARPCCVYTLDFGGGGILDSGVIDDVDGIVSNDVALQSSFLKICLSFVEFDLAGDFLTPSRVGSILKFSLDKAVTAIYR